MKKALKAFLYGILIIFILLLAVFLISWKSPPYYEVTAQKTEAIAIVPFGSYNGEHKRPYILSSDKYVVFGAEHTKDPDDPQIGSIRGEWNRLKPTIALVEGRLDFLLPGFMDPVEVLGEGGYVKYLAHQSGIPVYNWDLSKEVLADSMVKKFSPEQVALAQILNPYFSNLRHGKPDDPDSFVSGYLDRAAFVNQQDNIKSINDIDRLWRKYFPEGKDWRDTSDEYALPGYLANMMEYTNDLRNRHLVRVIFDLLEKGEKPFVICGSSHSFCIEPSLRFD